MKIKAIAATTHVDLHNMKMSKEVLESMVEQVNNKEQAISVGIEHDLMVAPIGKIISAKLISIGNGEFAVETEQEIFDTLGVKTINGQDFLEYLYEIKITSEISHRDKCNGFRLYFSLYSE